MQAGDKVRFTPIRGGNHDGNVYTVRKIGTMPSGEEVAWLQEKAGCVALWAIFPLERGLQSLNPQKHVHSNNANPR